MRAGHCGPLRPGPARNAAQRGEGEQRRRPAGCSTSDASTCDRAPPARRARTRRPRRAAGRRAMPQSSTAAWRTTTSARTASHRPRSAARPQRRIETPAQRDEPVAPRPRGAAPYSDRRRHDARCATRPISPPKRPSTSASICCACAPSSLRRPSGLRAAQTASDQDVDRPEQRRSTRGRATAGSATRGNAERVCARAGRPSRPRERDCRRAAVGPRVARGRTAPRGRRCAGRWRSPRREASLPRAPVRGLGVVAEEGAAAERTRGVDAAAPVVREQERAGAAELGAARQASPGRRGRAWPPATRIAWRTSSSSTAVG